MKLSTHAPAMVSLSLFSERASVRKEPFSDQLGLGLKIFLDNSSNNDEYTKDESTKPEIRLISNVIRSCRRLPSPEPAIF